MKKLYAFPIFCFLYLTAFSQKHPHQCVYPEGSTFELPADFKKYQKGEKTIVKLQTVVHVIYYEDFQYLSTEDVKEIIQKVNEDFRRQNADTVNTPDTFKPVAADTEIEFELATVDPAGGPTDGITHTKSPHEEFGGNNGPPLSLVWYDSTGGHDAWNTSKYVNIWLVRNISFLSVPGLSTLPSWHGTPRDGVIAGYRFPLFDERSLVHYLGHYLGLSHPFLYDYPQSSADTCSVAPGGPDKLEDTPNQLYSVQPFGHCPDFPYTDICSPDTPGVMYMNYMEYTPSDCKNMFTHDQAAVMNWVLDSVRFSLFEPVTSIEENNSDKNMEVHIYPNPVREKLIIETRNLSFSKKEYGIFDSMGRLVFTGVLYILPNSKNEINTAHLPNGIYWLKIKSGDKLKIERIMKL